MRWPPPTRRRSAGRGGPGYAADTASSGRPRCRSGALSGAPGEGLPDTATPRRSLRPRRRSPDRSPGPALPRSRRPAPDTGGAPAGHSAHRAAGRDGRRDPAAGPWRKERLAGGPRGARPPTAVSGARSRTATPAPSPTVQVTFCVQGVALHSRINSSLDPSPGLRGTSAGAITWHWTRPRSSCRCNA